MSLGISERLELDTLKRNVAEQQRRIESLEGAIRARTPAALAGCNATRQAEARRLDEAIASILASHASAPALTAKELGKALARAGFGRVIPERTLRRHLNSVRGHGHT